MREFVDVNMSNLDHGTDAIKVPFGKTKVSFYVVFGSSFAWSTTVMELQWTLARGQDETGRNLYQWNSFRNPVTISTSTTFKRNVSISGTRYLRLIPTTVGSTPDPNAVGVFEFS